jgi:hypothetical protein
MQVRLSTTLVVASRSFRPHLNRRVMIGQVAAYVSQVEPNVEVSTLELARPVALEQRLQDLDFQGGDRFVIFTQAPQTGELPAPPRPGDTMLRFAAGDFERHSHGKHEVVIGKSDESTQALPDIDLREVIQARHLPYISRQCLILRFDAPSQSWYALKSGQTRILIEDFELDNAAIPIHGSLWLRFYRATDNPFHNSQPLGTLLVSVESMRMNAHMQPLQTGQHPVLLRVGSERTAEFLHASEGLQLEQIVAALLRYHRVNRSADTMPYLMRLVAPSLPLADVKLAEGEFLYAAFDARYARSLLRLRDVHQADFTYTLVGGREDEVKTVGCRLQANPVDPSLDIDLYEAFIARISGLPQIMTPALFQVMFHPDEAAWWTQALPQTMLPVFLNNRRLTGAPVPLTSGDVFSIGPNVEHYYLRFEVEIRAQS